MKHKPNDQQAFLLRCWVERKTPSKSKPCWRFSVKEIGREERQHGFADLETLFAFLKAKMDADPKG